MQEKGEMIMKKIHLAFFAWAVALAPVTVSAVLVAELDFTGGASAWTNTVIDAGYSHTTELDGDPTKVGYAANTSASGAVNFFQEVAAPAGYTMSSITLDARVSGYSSWVMLGRVGLGLAKADFVPGLSYWGGIDTLASGVVFSNEPVTIDASADPSFTGLTSVWVGVEIHKGLAGVYVRPDVSHVELHAVLTSTNSAATPVPFSTVTVDDVVGVSFTGELAQVYRLQYAEDLVSPTWIDTDIFIRGTGGESIAFDTAGMISRKNYRIVEAAEGTVP